MRLYPFTRASQIKTGTRFRCVLDGNVIKDAKWYVDKHGGTLYLCQDVYEGSPCGDKHLQGYRYSFSFSGALYPTTFAWLKGCRIVVKEGDPPYEP